MTMRDWSKPLDLEEVQPVTLGDVLAKDIVEAAARDGRGMVTEAAQMPLMFRHYSGPEYKTTEDHKRLDAQQERVKAVMADGRYRTLDEIAELTHDPVASISAQLRHLRKVPFGSHVVDRRRRGPGALYEYNVLKPDGNPIDNNGTAADRLAWAIHRHNLREQRRKKA